MTQVKICGITNLADAMAALEAGVDLLGFNFYPKSPRYLAPEATRVIVNEIRSNAPHSSLIGLFVNETPTRINEIMAFAQLDYAQFHGDETVETITQFVGRAFRAIRPISAQQARGEAEQFHRPTLSTKMPSLLIDAYDPRAYGGTGQKADWHVAAEIVRQYSNVLLAGGLTVENVAEAVRTVLPWGVDVSSGVETAPGKKDHAKIRAFVQAAKGG